MKSGVDRFPSKGHLHSLSGDRGGLNASLLKQIIKCGDLTPCTPPRAVSEDYTLLGAGESHEESGRSFDLITGKAPPRAIVEPEEDDGVVFQALTFVDGHQRHGVEPLVIVKRDGPIVCALARGLEVNGSRIDDFAKPLPGAEAG
jgi:hypothetical protein